MEVFLEKLASKEPVPGGGGVSALVGALSAALCSMVGNLTTGKPKYADYEQEIQEILQKAEKKRATLLQLIEEDAKAFAPLARAYGIPKDDPSRETVMEEALEIACQPPLAIMREVYETIDWMETLETKGSKLAISDVGVAAACGRAALEGAIMNVKINTKSMKNRELAEKINWEADFLLKDGQKRCDALYTRVTEVL
ncbi:MAG: cyclodeaminase/cyclohydrolase family protein [Clostridia bacterium]|nr:cyclodeaminase/cyclohydrolase family protein [Clostridia bacterium]